MKGNFELGDKVLLIYDKKRRWLKTISDDEFHCNYGMIKLIDLVGMSYGGGIQTNTGIWIHAVQPTLMDWFDYFEHGSQIIYQKDAAMIIMLLDAKPGDIIFEAGTGSGALTSLLSRSVGKEGRVFTHEIRESAHKTAKKNHRRLGTSNVTFLLQDVTFDGFIDKIEDEKIYCDSMVLDMGDPWRAINNATKVLRPGSRLVIFIPTYQQLEKMNLALLERNFRDIRAVEYLEREIQLKKEAIRPATRMIGHTGFLMHATFYPIIEK